MTTNAEHAAATRREYVGRGLCPYCYGARRAEPGREACRPCRAERNRRYNERRRQRLESGLCTKCGRPRGQTTYCETCRTRSHKWTSVCYRRMRRRAACTQCGGVAVRGQILCRPCAGRNGQQRRERWAGFVERRATCEHPRWSVKLHILGEPGVLAGQSVVRVRLKETCPVCRKTRQRTTWTETGRVAWLLRSLDRPGAAGAIERGDHADPR